MCPGPAPAPGAHSQPPPFTDGAPRLPGTEPRLTSNGVALPPAPSHLSRHTPRAPQALPLRPAGPAAQLLCPGLCSPLCLQCPPQLCPCPSSSSSNATLPTGLHRPVWPPAWVTSLRSPLETPNLQTHSGLGYLSKDTAPLRGGESVPGGQARHSHPSARPWGGGGKRSVNICLIEFGQGATSRQSPGGSGTRSPGQGNHLGRKKTPGQGPGCLLKAGQLPYRAPGGCLHPQPRARGARVPGPGGLLRSPEARRRPAGPRAPAPRPAPLPRNTPAAF